MTIELLRQVIAPPASPIATGSASEWQRIEDELHIQLPSDYKDYVSTYGVGCIDDFLWVYNPFTKNDFLNLVKQVPKRIDALRDARRQFPEDVPYALFPSDKGLFPWGITDNGDTLYWQVCDNQTRPIVVIGEARGPRWCEFHHELSELLAALLLRNEIVEFFPDDFPSGDASFDARE